MNKKRKGYKYIAPIILVAICVLYELVWIVALIAFNVAGIMPWWGVLLIMVIPALGMVGLIVALVQRIREIKGGEEDVASKY